MSDQTQANYWAFLLRLWRETPDLPFRAMLEDPHTGERHGFANMTQLIFFLQQLDKTAPDETNGE